MLKRRSMLQALAGLSIAAANPLLMAADAGKKRRLPWANWSGSQRCVPEARVAPMSVGDLQELLRSSQGIVRPVGAGHSFSPLVPTDGTLVSMARLSGLASHDEQTLQASIYGGTRLGDIGQPLADAGQALIIMPDIDEQSLAGSLATATHGTGAGLGAMHNYVTALQLVTASGELVECSADNNPELFDAARVSLGSLGIVTQVTMQNQAPFRLRREIIWRDIEDILENTEQLAANHRNFEFFYIPFSGKGWTETLDITEEGVGATDKTDFNDSTSDLQMARDWLENWPRLRQLVLGTAIDFLDDEVAIENSWKNYAHERNVRFNEMEYHLPRENGVAAMREVIAALEGLHPEVFFPIEVRFVKSDDAWLSPFYQRDACSIALHRFHEEDFLPYFRTLEPILRKHGGRPHWGKLNTLSGADFKALYPRWGDFAALRQEMDPQGRFLNEYLAGLFA